MKFEPFAQMNKAWETWSKLAEDSYGRWSGMAKEIEKLETKNVQRLTSAIDESAMLTKETLSYSTQLAADWRKITLEAFQQMGAVPSADAR